LSSTRIGIVGIGKIARDQHIPAIGGSESFELVACASRHARVDGVDNFPDLAAMLKARLDLEAVAICTPPQVHYEAAKLALESGKHVLLEKPPCSTTRQLADLAARAARAKRTLFQTWHSRFAAGVAPARQWLETRTIRSGRITWKEDVRQWHPGQTWIWRAGGFGVFDPGINAISILTEIAPAEIFVSKATLYFPANCEAPIAADLTFTTDAGAAIAAEFDFRQVGPQSWDIELQTDDGALALAMGGAQLRINGEAIGGADEGEYPALYRRFAELIGAGASEVDSRPFQLTADAFLAGARIAVDPCVE
jgi:predicted dehydrogenase